MTHSRLIMLTVLSALGVGASAASAGTAFQWATVGTSTGISGSQSRSSVSYGGKVKPEDKRSGSKLPAFRYGLRGVRIQQGTYGPCGVFPIPGELNAGGREAKTVGYVDRDQSTCQGAKHKAMLRRGYVVNKLQVCTGRGGRAIRGVRVSGGKLDSTGRLRTSRSASDHYKLAGCATWHSAVSCPSGQVAIGVSGFKKSDKIGGLKLLCTATVSDTAAAQGPRTRVKTSTWNSRSQPRLTVEVANTNAELLRVARAQLEVSVAGRACRGTNAQPLTTTASTTTAVELPCNWKQLGCADRARSCQVTFSLSTRATRGAATLRSTHTSRVTLRRR